VTLLPLTTVEKARQLAGQLTPAEITNLDEMLEDSILAVSQAFETYLQLPFLIESRTETYSLDTFAPKLWLRSYYGRAMPVPTISSLRFRSSFTDDWADQDEVDPATYALSTDPPGAILCSGGWPAGEEVVRVIYTSGFVGPLGSGTEEEALGVLTDQFVELYPAISNLAARQAVYEYRRRKTPEKETISQQGSSSTREAVKLLPAVVERLATYRRKVHFG
jgi:hypothetical protein